MKTLGFNVQFDKPFNNERFYAVEVGQDDKFITFEMYSVARFVGRLSISKLFDHAKRLNTLRTNAPAMAMLAKHKPFV